jgi:hypothetical protein
MICLVSSQGYSTTIGVHSLGNRQHPGQKDSPINRHQHSRTLRKGNLSGHSERNWIETRCIQCRNGKQSSVATLECPTRYLQ